MRARALLWSGVTVLASAACGPKGGAPGEAASAAPERAASPAGSAPNASGVVAGMAGAWEGRTTLRDTDSVTSTFRVVIPGDTGAWTLSFPADTALPPVAGRVVAAGGDSVVVQWEPFDALTEPPRRRALLARGVMRAREGKLVGTYELRFASSPDSVIERGRSEASRVR